MFHLNRDGVAPHVWNEHPATRDLDLIAPRWQCEERIAPPPFVRDSVDLNGHRKQSKQVTEWSMVGPNYQPGLRCRLSQDSLRSRGTLVDYTVINVGALPAGFAGYRCRSVTGAPVMPERGHSPGDRGRSHASGLRTVTRPIVLSGRAIAHRPDRSTSEPNQPYDEGKPGPRQVPI